MIQRRNRTSSELDTVKELDNLTTIFTMMKTGSDWSKSGLALTSTSQPSLPLGGGRFNRFLRSLCGLACDLLRALFMFCCECCALVVSEIHFTFSGCEQSQVSLSRHNEIERWAPSSSILHIMWHSDAVSVTNNRNIVSCHRKMYMEKYAHNSNPMQTFLKYLFNKKRTRRKFSQILEYMDG